MSDLGFELFNGRGEFVMPSEEQIAALDQPTRERWQAVRDAATDSEAADAALKAAQDRVVDFVKQVREAEDYVRQHYPPMSATDAARAFIRTEQQKRM